MAVVIAGNRVHRVHLIHRLYEYNLEMLELPCSRANLSLLKTHVENCSTCRSNRQQLVGVALQILLDESLPLLSKWIAGRLEAPEDSVFTG